MTCYKGDDDALYADSTFYSQRNGTIQIPHIHCHKHDGSRIIGSGRGPWILEG